MKLYSLIERLQKAHAEACRRGASDIEVVFFTPESCEIQMNKIELHTSNALDRSRWRARIS